ADPADPVVDVERPVAALAELAVADDVDTGFDLLAHHLLDRVFQTGLVGRLVVGLAGFDQLEELDELRRAHQAADVSGQYTIRDAVGAGGHAKPPVLLVLLAATVAPGTLEETAWQIQAKALNRRHGRAGLA